MRKMPRLAKTAALTLPMLLVMSQAAFAYDPCQRATQEREAARDQLNTYYANNCTWSYEPSHCRNSQWGYELQRRYLAASANMVQACRW